MLLDSLLVHFVLELETAKDLPCVALEDVQLLHDHLVVGTFICNLVQFVVKTQVLKTRQKLRLLLFGGRLIYKHVNELKGLQSELGELGLRKRNNQLVKKRFVVLFGLVDGCLGDQIVGIGALG